MDFPMEAAGIAVARALAEDAAGDDVTTRWSVPEDLHCVAEIITREHGVAAGLPLLEEIYSQLGAEVKVELVAEEGAAVNPGDRLARLTGQARDLITGERTAVNFLQRLCGIASLTRQYVSAIDDLPVQLLDTRKTAPGLRHLDKYAVKAGGGSNHRMSLSAMVLLKENHIAAAGGITAAVRSVRRGMTAEGRDVRIEVEVEDVAGAREALAAAVDWIMLDNMSPAQTAEVVRLREQLGGEIETRLEASGTITLATLRAVALTGVDAVSVGSITHSAPALDLSMLLAGAPREGVRDA